MVTESEGDEMGKDGAKKIVQWKRVALAAGWTVRRGGKHLKWCRPDGSLATTTPCSPGEGRSTANTRADLRRAGLDVS